MKTIIPLTTVAVVALGLGACKPPTDAYGHWGKQAEPMKTLSKLDCPDEKGDFHRVSMASDGRSCIYQGDHDSMLELKLVNVTGDAKATLAQLDAEAHALVPVEPTPPKAPPAPAAPGAPEAPSAPDAPAAASGPTNVSMHPAGGKLPSGRSEDSVNIDLPGIHIHADDDKAKVRVAGIRVDADDKTNSAHVEGSGHTGLGSFTVDAHEGGAIVKMDDSDANIRTRVQYSSDNAGPQGDHTAGYVARGPRAGPLVVAVVRVKSTHDDNDDVFRDATALVKANTGR